MGLCVTSAWQIDKETLIELITDTMVYVGLCLLPPVGSGYWLFALKFNNVSDCDNKLLSLSISHFCSLFTDIVLKIKSQAPVVWLYRICVSTQKSSSQNLVPPVHGIQQNVINTHPPARPENEGGRALSEVAQRSSNTEILGIPSSSNQKRTTQWF